MSEAYGDPPAYTAASPSRGRGAGTSPRSPVREAPNDGARAQGSPIVGQPTPKRFFNTYSNRRPSNICRHVLGTRRVGGTAGQPRENARTPRAGTYRGLALYRLRRATHRSSAGHRRAHAWVAIS